MLFDAVLTGLLPPFWSMMSSWRKTFFPSALTSIDHIWGFAEPLILFDITPKRLPASSPVLIAYFDVLTMMGFPSALTELTVSAASEDIAMLG